MLLDVTKPSLNLDPSLSLYDEADPRSLVNILPEVVSRAVLSLAKGDHGYLLHLDENTLYREIQKLKYQPKVVDNIIRTKFWMEYERIHATGEPLMKMTAVYGRSISKETFYKYFITDLIRISWMLCPPTDYEAAIREALQLGVSKLRHAIETIDILSTTNLSGKRLDKFLVVFRMLEERLHGFKVLPGPKKVRSMRLDENERALVADDELEGIEDQLMRAAERVERLRAKAASDPSKR